MKTDSCAVWEWLILFQGADIPVDLLFIYPVLRGISLWSLWTVM